MYISESEMPAILERICESVHATCCSECPVFAVKNKIPEPECPCFKDGRKMLQYLQDNRIGNITINLDIY